MPCLSDTYHVDHYKDPRKTLYRHITWVLLLFFLGKQPLSFKETPRALKDTF